MKKIIGPDIRVLSWPLMVIFLTASLFIAGFNASYEAITTRIDAYKTAKVTERSLEAKLDILKNAEKGALDRTNRLANILPDSVPAAAAISQIKKAAEEGNLNLVNIDLKNEVPFSDNVNSIDFNFETAAEDVLELIKLTEKMHTLAPINNLKKIEIQVTPEGSVSSIIQTSLFWSGFPKNLASVTSPISDLNEEEKAQLDRLEDYLLPSFSIINATSPNDRVNPFN